MLPVRTLTAGFVVVMLPACGDRRDVMPDDSLQATSTPVQALDPSTITAAQIALGDSIFHGQVAGAICWTCHGEDAAGRLTVAPNLTDSTWLHSDGSYPAIIATIAAGVVKPKESSSPMPQGGGTSFSHEQLRAVAAYVYSLSHPEVRARRP